QVCTPLTCSPLPAPPTPVGGLSVATDGLSASSATFQFTNAQSAGAPVLSYDIRYRDGGTMTADEFFAAASAPLVTPGSPGSTASTPPARCLRWPPISTTGRAPPPPRFCPRATPPGPWSGVSSHLSARPRRSPYSGVDKRGETPIIPCSLAPGVCAGAFGFRRKRTKDGVFALDAYHQPTREVWPPGPAPQDRVARADGLPAAPRRLRARLHHHAEEAE